MINRFFAKIELFFYVSVLLFITWGTQLIPFFGEFYAKSAYPTISYCLSAFSNLFPFAIGDLFIFLSIAGIILYPIYARCHLKKIWKHILLNNFEYLLWVYVWFYLAWGLNYSQPNFYERTGIPYTTYTPENFRKFIDTYIANLNASYTDVTSINEPLVSKECVRSYNYISDTLGIHRPPHQSPRVKTMFFPPLISKVETCYLHNTPPPTVTNWHICWVSPAKQKPIFTPIRSVLVQKSRAFVSVVISLFSRMY